MGGLSAAIGGVKYSIENEGIYTVGTVTHLVKIKGRNNYTKLVFEFDHEGRTIVGSIRNDKYFNQAVIGKKYVVRYVPEKITEKTFTDYAKIYIDIPVLQEHIDGQDIQDYAARDSTIKE